MPDAKKSRQGNKKKMEKKSTKTKEDAAKVVKENQATKENDSVFQNKVKSIDSSDEVIDEKIIV